MFVVLERGGTSSVREDESKIEKDPFPMEVPIELSGSDDEEQVTVTTIDGTNQNTCADFVEEEDEDDDEDDEVDNSVQMPSSKPLDNAKCIDTSTSSNANVTEEDTVCDENSFAMSNRSAGQTTHTTTANVKLVRVVPLPHARSDVWSYFGFIADDSGEIHDKRKTICKICATILSYSGNTTNLFTHLKAMHPDVRPQKINPALRAIRSTPIKGSRKRKNVEDAETTSSQCITILPVEASKNNANNNNSNSNSNSNSNNNTYNGRHVQCTSTSAYDTELDANKSNGSNEPVMGINNGNAFAPNIAKNFKTLDESCTISTAREEEITNALANFIAKDCRPLGIVNGKGFEDLLQTLVPGYKIPEMSKLEPLVRKKYNDIRYDLFMRSINSDSDILM